MTPKRRHLLRKAGLSSCRLHLHQPAAMNPSGCEIHGALQKLALIFFPFSLPSVGEGVALPGISSPPRIPNEGPGLSQHREDLRSSPTLHFPLPMVLTQGRAGSGEAQVGAQPRQSLHYLSSFQCHKESEPSAPQGQQGSTQCWLGHILEWHQSAAHGPAGGSWFGAS